MCNTRWLVIKQKCHVFSMFFGCSNKWLKNTKMKTTIDRSHAMVIWSYCRCCNCGGNNCENNNNNNNSNTTSCQTKLKLEELWTRQYAYDSHTWWAISYATVGFFLWFHLENMSVNKGMFLVLMYMDIQTYTFVMYGLDGGVEKVIKRF